MSEEAPQAPLSVVDRMLTHDAEAGEAFLARQPALEVPALLDALRVIERECMSAMMRDVPAFMAYKSPTPAVVVPKTRFRETVELAMSSRVDDLKTALQPLSLDELSALGSLTCGLAFQWTQMRRRTTLLKPPAGESAVVVPPPEIEPSVENGDDLKSE